MIGADNVFGIDGRGRMTGSFPVWNPCCKVAINPAQRTTFAGAAGAEKRPNWCTGTSKQREVYVFSGAN